MILMGGLRIRLNALRGQKRDQWQEIENGAFHDKIPVTYKE
jgi:hypothetical protein